MDRTPSSQCPSCGLIFAKYLKGLYRRDDDAHSPAVRRSDTRFCLRLSERLFYVDTPVDSIGLLGRAMLFALFFVWGWRFILMDYGQLVGGLPEINSSFLHGVNLVFHEAGHVLFSPFGRFLSVLGGSLMQLLMPALVILTFLLRQRDPFGASIGLWWFAQSLLDLAPYVYDAAFQRMILLGGVTGRDRPGYHDWHNILESLGLLEYTHSIAGLVYGAGVLAMLLAFAWGGYILFLQYKGRARG